ncbi:MAG: hypothetical protein U1B80_03145, partial [Anaerolineaceae bacterium]|nr:hypothetical protein [Anaerolineaceae bacterium]
MYAARIGRRKSAEECAAILNLPLEQYMDFEKGVAAPSLPMLETFASFLAIPVMHFWGNQSL